MNQLRINFSSLSDENLREIDEFLASNYQNSSIDEISLLLSPEELAELSAIAQNLILRAYYLEPEVSKLVDNAKLVEEEKEKNAFAGFDYRLKLIDRLMIKIYKDSIKYNVSFIEAANRIYDVLRYTIICPIDEYISRVDEILNRLVDLGFSVDKLKNKWNDKYCKGIQCQLSFKGFKLEIQFHTEQSHRIKEEETRRPYNISRKYEETKDELSMEELKLLICSFTMRRVYNDKIVIPNGARRYTFSPKTKKNTQYVKKNKNGNV